MKDVKIWIIEHNKSPGSDGATAATRLRNPEDVRNAHQELEKESDDERALEQDWLMAVPTDKWDEHYPDKPLPPQEEWGEEKIEGVMKTCAYIIKPGCKADHFTVKRRSATRIKHTTKLAKVQEGDHDRFAEALQSTRAKAQPMVLSKKGG